MDVSCSAFDSINRGRSIRTVKPRLIISGKYHVCINIHVSVSQRYDSTYFI